MSDYFLNGQSAVVDSNRILYTASAFARDSLLYLQEIGELKALRAHESKRKGLDSYLFLTIISGSGTLEYNGSSFHLSTGDCAFIDCRLPYSHRTSDDLWSLRWIHFNGISMGSIYEKYRKRGGKAAFSPSGAFSPPYAKQVEIVWAKLMQTAKSSDHMRDMLINQHLSELLTLLMSESWHPEERGTGIKRQSVLDVKEYIDQHYAEKFTLDDLSSHFYIDKYYLTKSFKEQFGTSVMSYQNALRITRAKQMLRFSDKTVEEIGYEVGIGDPSYFSRVFRKIEGISPREYRVQW